MHRLLALHKHWVAADAVKQFLFAAIPVDNKKVTLPENLIEVAQVWSTMLRLEVFYALMYVVVKGYQALDCHDPVVDELLAETEYLDAFRRFRNATFHYQEDPISPKLVEFLAAEGSEKWAQKLYAALNSFFERNLPIKEFVDDLRKRNA
jgi:hypothetical protein